MLVTVLVFSSFFVFARMTGEGPVRGVRTISCKWSEGIRESFESLFRVINVYFLYFFSFLFFDCKNLCMDILSNFVKSM